MRFFLLFLFSISALAAPVNPVNDINPRGIACAGGKYAPLGASCPPGQSLILFEENFDDQPDWFVATSGESCNNIGTCNTTLPIGWDFLRNNESWHPSESDPTKQPSQRIGALAGGGKSWIRTHESILTNTSTFGDDTLLLKDLGQEVKEVYISFKIKFDPGWQWNQVANTKFKMFRIQHFDGPVGSASPWDFFTNGDNAPIMILDIKHSPDFGMRWAWARRCDPQETFYYCDGENDADQDPPMVCPDGVVCTGPFGYPTHEEMFGSEWHTIKMRLKINSELNVYDGIFQLWFDGKLNISKLDIAWLRTGSNSNIGFNMIGLGGNTTNWFDDPANKSEQWYAIDDVVVSLEDIQ